VPAPWCRPSGDSYAETVGPGLARPTSCSVARPARKAGLRVRRRITSTGLSPNDRTQPGKRAELLAGVGAVVVVVDLGLLFCDSLRPFAIPSLVIGGVAYANGMFAKHRVERRQLAGRVWWAELSCWACWVAPWR
jgi:hypothetical protein